MTPEICDTCQHYEPCAAFSVGWCCNNRGTYDLPVTPDCSCGDWKAKQVEDGK